MYAEAALVLERVDDAVTVPAMAIDRADNATTVLVVLPSKVIERRPVTLGLETSEAAQVLSGLSVGDQVVIGTRSQLRQGQTVEPRQAPAAAPAGGR
jgi:macrolide-specific efflux system membrane fusion protein